MTINHLAEWIPKRKYALLRSSAKETRKESNKVHGIEQSWLAGKNDHGGQAFTYRKCLFLQENAYNRKQSMDRQEVSYADSTRMKLTLYEPIRYKSRKM